MNRILFTLFCAANLAIAIAQVTCAQTQPARAVPMTAAPQFVDGIAARIEDDVITESEVRQLGAFQKLVDGQSKPRAELIRELEDQWIVRGEAQVARYAQPSSFDVNHAYDALIAKFRSPEEFKQRCSEAGLSEGTIRRMLAEQLYLSGFLDYRFRPTAQIEEPQLDDYYNNEFVPKLKAQGSPVPPLADVEDAIREVLVQRVIDQRSAQWLNETRTHLKVDVMPQGDQQ